LETDVGYHSVLKSNCVSENRSLNSTGAASRKMKNRMARMKTMALTPLA